MQIELLRQAAVKHKKEIMPPYDVIMDLEGFDAICALSEHLGGSTVYIPNVKTIFMRCLEREAASEFDGANFHALAHKYGLTERHLRKVLPCAKKNRSVNRG